MTGLDVERLARATATASYVFGNAPDWASISEEEQAEYLAEARNVAAEYARLTEERCDVILRIVGGWDIETTAECILPADHDGDHEPGDPA